MLVSSRWTCFAEWWRPQGHICAGSVRGAKPHNSAMHATIPHTSSTSPLLLPREGVARLEHWGVIEVSGADSAGFLQGQLTNDVAHLSPTQARLAAFCSAKGRMQASFIALQGTKGDILLLCSKDLLAPTLKRLSMFVMRAKAQLRDASADYSIYGLLGASTGMDGDHAPEPWQARVLADTRVVQLYPALGVARQMCLIPAGAPAPEGPALSFDDWQCGEVLSGVATLTAAVVDAFVPQMLNYESVGGVSFKKGCYPGQEVVARSQFRGILKRRAYIVELQQPVVPSPAAQAGAALAMFAGQEVYSTQDASQPCGVVAQAARHATGRWVGIVSMQTSAAADHGLCLGSAGGAALALLPLPYALLEDI